MKKIYLFDNAFSEKKDADGEAVEIPKRMDAEKAAFGWLDGE